MCPHDVASGADQILSQRSRHHRTVGGAFGSLGVAASRFEKPREYNAAHEPDIRIQVSDSSNAGAFGRIASASPGSIGSQGRGHRRGSLVVPGRGPRHSQDEAARWPPLLSGSRLLSLPVRTDGGPLCSAGSAGPAPRLLGKTRGRPRRCSFLHTCVQFHTHYILL